MTRKSTEQGPPRRRGRGRRSGRPWCFSVFYVLGRSSSIWASWCLPFAALAALLFAPQLLDSPEPGSGRMQKDVLHVVWLLSYGLLSTVVVPITFRAATGRRDGLGRAILAGLARLPALVALAIVGLAATWIAAAVFGAVGELLEPIELAKVLFVVSALIAYLFVWSRMFVAVPACILGPAGPVASLRVSWRLTRRYEAYMLVLWILSILSGVVPVILFGIGVWAITGGDLPAWLRDYVMQAFVMPFLDVLATVTYLELRVAQEGASRDELAMSLA